VRAVLKYSAEGCVLAPENLVDQDSAEPRTARNGLRSLTGQADLPSHLTANSSRPGPLGFLSVGLVRDARPSSPVPIAAFPVWDDSFLGSRFILREMDISIGTGYGAAVLGTRGVFERAVSRRWPGWAVLALVVVLLALVGVHPVLDACEEAALICEVIVLTAAIVLPRVGEGPTPRPQGPAPKRPRPSPCRAPSLCFSADQYSFPLRR
jgi:hypothetical protein